MRYLLVLCLLAQPVWAQRVVDDMHASGGGNMEVAVLKWIVAAVFGVYGVVSLTSDDRAFRYLVAPIALAVAVLAILMPAAGIGLAMVAVILMMLMAAYSR